MNSLIPDFLSKSKWLDRLIEILGPNLELLHNKLHIVPTTVFGLPALIILSIDIYRCVIKEKYDWKFKITLFNFILIFVVVFILQIRFM